MSTVADWLAGAVRACAEVGEADDDALWPHQRTAAARLVAMAEQFGGAILADAVGLGKTRASLAAAGVLARRARQAGVSGTIWCCVPAHLGHEWRTTATELGLAGAVEVWSHAMLSRGRVPARDAVAIVIDEAHRFRNVGTARRDTVSEWCARAPTLLVTATPVVNGVDDLLRLLELFARDEDIRAAIGVELHTAFELARRGEYDITNLARLVTVRRTDGEGQVRRPGTKLEVLDYRPSEDELWIWQNLEPELRQLVGGLLFDEWPKQLFVAHLLRAWEAGALALVETLRGLVAFHERWLEADGAGRALNRREFRTMFGEVPEQNVLPFLYASGREGGASRAAVLADKAKLETLLERAEAASARDGRLECIADVVGREEVERLLVFTSYRRAARQVFDQLRARTGGAMRVGLLTGDECVATGLGRTTARELMERFSPNAQGRNLRPHETLDVLVATDCIAEGVSLHDCAHIVLADLPHTAVAVAQRVGRLLRPGSPHERVTVYFPRPTDWVDSLGMRRRLDSKLRSAASAGMGMRTPIPHATDAAPARNPHAALTRLDRLAAALPDAPVIAGSWRAPGHEPAVTWVLARIEPGGHPWLFEVSPEGAVEDLEVLLGRLEALMLDDRALVPGDLPPAVESAANARRDRLEAARLAPHRVAIDSPAARAWARLREEANLTGEVAADLRSRLLCRHPRGIDRRLSAALQADIPLTRLIRLVRELPAPNGARTRIEIISTLTVGGCDEGY